MEKAGIRNLVASSEDDARRWLASGSFAVAVIGGDFFARNAQAKRWSSYGAPVIVVTSVFSARAVLDLASEADLVLPSPLEPDTLLRAIELVTERKDEVTAFAREHKLSPRETALLRLALSGLNNDEAAQVLGCSRATVSSFWNRIFRKTGVSGQRDVVILLHRKRSRSGTFRIEPLPAGPEDE
jgi:DNA-binding NarL/FixJ family response regulator